jgi:hypothetical protein
LLSPDAAANDVVFTGVPEQLRVSMLHADLTRSRIHVRVIGPSAPLFHGLLHHNLGDPVIVDDRIIPLERYPDDIVSHGIGK